MTCTRASPFPRAVSTRQADGKVNYSYVAGGGATTRLQIPFGEMSQQERSIKKTYQQNIFCHEQNIPCHKHVTPWCNFWERTKPQSAATAPLLWGSEDPLPVPQPTKITGSTIFPRANHQGHTQNGMLLFGLWNLTNFFFLIWFLYSPNRNN